MSDILAVTEFRLHNISIWFECVIKRQWISSLERIYYHLYAYLIMVNDRSVN